MRPSTPDRPSDPPVHSHPHHAHDHGHAHGHAHGSHVHTPSSSRILFGALALTLGFAAVEAVAGWLSGSLALIGDAGHMLNDAVALGVAAFAAWIAQRPPSVRHTYGFGRAEVIAALFNSGAMLALVVFIAIEAIGRLRFGGEVAGKTVMFVAFGGLLVNLLVAWLLSRGENDSINVRAALLHVLGDLLGSVAAIVSGAVVYFTGWQAADPILAMLIGFLILWSSLRLLREALHALMEGTPADLSIEEIGLAMAAEAGVASVHDLHVWAVRPGQVMLTAHVVVRDMAGWPALLASLRGLLSRRFRIGHVTLQPEPASEVRASPVNFAPHARRAGDQQRS